MIRMSVPAFEGYVREMSALRAAELLDQIASATPSKEWIDALQRMAGSRDDDEIDAPSSGPPSLFTLNRRPVSLVELEGELASLLGGGFSAN